MAVFADQLDLRTAVVEAVSSAAIVDVWPRLLQFAENEINRKSRNRQQITAVDLTFTSGVATLPTDFLEMINLYYDGYGTEMVQAPLSTVKQTYSNYGFYAIDGSSVLINGFTGDKAIEYYAKVPTISASLTDTNWLLAAYPDVYMATCAFEAAKHIKSAELAGIYERMADRAFTDMKIDSDRARYSQASVRVAGCTP